MEIEEISVMIEYLLFMGLLAIVIIVWALAFAVVCTVWREFGD